MTAAARAEMLQPAAVLQRLARADFRIDLATLLGLPFALMAFTRSWTYLAPTGYIDPYLYTGYFRNLRGLLEAAPGAYYGSRLPWLLLGNLVYSVFPPDAANLILRFLLFYLATFAIYGIIRLIWRNRSAAVVIAVLLGVNTYFLRLIYWDYINGPAVVAFLVAVLCFTAAARGVYPRLAIFAGGLWLITAASIHVFLSTLIPAAAVFYLAVNYRGNKNGLVMSVLLAGIGVAVGFIFYAIVNMQLGGQYNYLEPQLNLAQTLNSAPYKTTFSHLAREKWLEFPAVALAVSVALLMVPVAGFFRRRRSGVDGDTGILAAVGGLQMLLVAAPFLYYQLTGKHPLLDDYPYANYLIPFSILAIATALALGLSTAPGKLRAPLAAVAVVVLMTPFAVGSSGKLNLCNSCLLTERAHLIAILAAGALAGAAFWRSWPAAVLAVVLLSGLNTGEFRNSSVVYFTGQDTWHDRFLLVYEADDIVRRDARDENIRLWYSGHDNFSGVYAGVAYLHLGRFLIGNNYPELPAGNIISVGNRIAVLTQSKEEPASQLASPFAALGLEPAVVHREVVSGKGDQFNVYIIEARPKDAVAVWELSPADFKIAQQGAAVEPDGEGRVKVTTPSLPWSYTALLNLGQGIPEDLADNPAVIHILARPISGLTGIGVLKNNRSAWITAYPFDSGNGKTIDIYMNVPELGETSDIVVMNWAKSGKGKVEILEVTVTVLPGP